MRTRPSRPRARTGGPRAHAAGCDRAV